MAPDQPVDPGRFDAAKNRPLANQCELRAHQSDDKFRGYSRLIAVCSENGAPLIPAEEVADESLA